MVFGVFDGLHEGHRALLKKARNLGDYLVVVVAQDHIVEKLKGHEPRLDLAERFSHLEAEDGVDQVLVGDEEHGTWEVVKANKPDIIALGYDQTVLKSDLESHMDKFQPKPDIVVLDAYEPNTMHSSIINNG